MFVLYRKLKFGIYRNEHVLKMNFAKKTCNIQKCFLNTI